MAAFFNAELMQQIDVKTRLLVAGFFREIEESAKTDHGNSPYYNTPDLFVRLCLSYYYIIKEEFEYGMDGIVINSTFQTVEYGNTSHSENISLTNGWRSVFGRHKIQSTSNCRCLWKIKFTKNGDGGTSFSIIGIASNRNRLNVPFHRNTEDINYSYYPQCNQKFCKYTACHAYGHYGALSAEKSFIVIMKLDLEKGTLSCALQKDEEDAEPQQQGVMFDDVERKEGLDYSLAISFDGIVGKAEILDYRVEHDRKQ